MKNDDARRKSNAGALDDSFEREAVLIRPAAQRGYESAGNHAIQLPRIEWRQPGPYPPGAVLVHVRTNIPEVDAEIQYSKLD